MNWERKGSEMEGKGWGENGNKQLKKKPIGCL
jgi:hypothetical protein